MKKFFGFLIAASFGSGLLVVSSLQQTTALPADTSLVAVDAERNSEQFVASGSTLEKIDEASLETFLNEFESEMSLGSVMESNRVVGGSPVSFPSQWMAFVAAQRTDANGKKFSAQCGGSVVASGWVLTAAHCVDGAEAIAVKVGQVDWREGEWVPAADFFLDPTYDSESYGVGDTALVQVATPTDVQPIFLARPEDSSLYPAGTTATVAGWGLTSSGGEPSYLLQEGSYPIQSTSDCRDSFFGFDADENICAGFQAGQSSGPVGSCKGDSGGPLMVPSGDSRTMIQIGTVAYGRGDCTSLETPGVYMRTAAVYDMIDNTVGGLPKAPDTAPPASFVPVGPTRVVDTRRNGSRVAAGSTLTVDVGAQYANQSISVNLAVTDASGAGFAALYACDQARPSTSSLNYQPGQAIANGVITKVSSIGTVCVYMHQAADVILDLFGVFASNEDFSPVGPIRVVDTRVDGSRVAAGSTLTVDVGAWYANQSISVNLAVTDASGAGFAALYACDQARPSTSSLNYQPGQAIANGVITKVSSIGTVCVYMHQAADVILDLFGMFPPQMT